MVEAQLLLLAPLTFFVRLMIKVHNHHQPLEKWSAICIPTAHLQHWWSF